ncbi:MAG: polysaccharide deacetylase family protein [Microthrixaceae bacterium]|nr:polysaccharide deacetylase family protein [Microthrixaceae bacterium]
MAAGESLRPLLKLAARGADVVRPPATGIVVLIYHRVGAVGGGQMNLPVDTFRCQVEWLAEHTRVLSLDDAVAEISGAGPVAPGVVVTFDDGTADWIDVVAPVLVEHRVPATFYLTTGYPSGEHPLPDGEKPLSWRGVEELASTGVATIGSHTHSHRLLDRLEPAEIADELDRSIDLIASHLGTAPTHFAYPKAVAPSVAARTAVRSRFRSAALAGTRPNRAGDDPYELSRSPVQLADSFADFGRKVAGGMGFEDSLRRRLNTVRYRGASR